MQEKNLKNNNQKGAQSSFNNEASNNISNANPLNESQASIASNPKNEVISFIYTALVFLFLWLFIRGSVIEAFKIPSGSMIPTLRVKDYLLVNKLSYGIRLPFVADTIYEYAKPKKGDIVVFTKEIIDNEEEKDMNFIKRVIATEGDTVELKDMTVYVNDVPQKEDYAQWVYGGRKDGEFSKITVPKGHVFLMGDNRDMSKDSRFWRSPFLPTKRIKGRAFFIYWSFNDFKRIFSIIK